MKKTLTIGMAVLALSLGSVAVVAASNGAVPAANITAESGAANQAGEAAQNGELGQQGQGGDQGQSGELGEKGQGGEGNDAAPAAPKK